MADSKLSALPAVTPAAADLLYVVQGGVSSQGTVWAAVLGGLNMPAAAAGAGGTVTVHAPTAAAGSGLAGGDLVLTSGAGDGAGAHGKLRLGDSTLYGPAAGDWTLNLDHAVNNVVFQTNGSECLRLLASGGGVKVSGGLTLGTACDLLALPANQALGGASLNDYAPGKSHVQRWTATAPVNVTGMSAPAGTDGTVRLIWNTGANTITLTNQDVASAAANRWLTTTGANLALAANRCAMAVYDNTTAAWRVTLLP